MLHVWVYLVLFLSFVLNNDAAVLRLVVFVAVVIFIRPFSFYCGIDEEMIIYFVNTVIGYKCICIS